MERKKRLIGFLEEANDKDVPKPPSGGENTDNQEEQMSPEDAEKQFLQNKVKEFQQKKDQEEQMVQAEVQKKEDRWKKIHTKFGRMLATPEELIELDKEREEREKQENDEKEDELEKESQQIEPEDEYTYYEDEYYDVDNKDEDENEEDELDESSGGQSFKSLDDVKNTVKNIKDIKDGTPYYIGIGQNKRKMTGKQVKEALLKSDGEKNTAKKANTNIDQEVIKDKSDKIWKSRKKELEKSSKKKIDVKKSTGKKEKVSKNDTDFEGYITQGDDIDSIVRERAWNLEIAAPGNTSSIINETGTGYLVITLLKDLEKKGGKSFYFKNGDANIEKLTNHLKDGVRDTLAGQKSLQEGGEEKLDEVCRAAALSAISESQRVKRTLKENKLKLKDVNISAIWGSQQSKNNACGALIDSDVQKVNGMDVKTYVKPDGIIQSGGGGGDPTDTMILIIPKKGKTKNAIILHTSNKMGTGNLQGNSSIEKNAEWILGTLKGHKKFKDAEKLTNNLYKKLKEKNNQIKDAVSKVVPEYSKDALKQIKDEGKKNDYWGMIRAKYGDKKSSDKEVYEKWRKHIIEESIKDPDEEGKIKLSATDKRLMGMFAKTNKKAFKKVNELYHDQFREYNEYRKKMNSSLGNNEGDKVFSKLFFHRLHINGEDKAGIPSKYFELNMGNNESGIKFDDKSSRPVKKIKGKYYYVTETGAPDGEFKGNMKELSTNPNHATVVNDEVLAKMFGQKLPLDKKFYDNIKVDNVTFSDEGNIGTAIIYIMVKGKKMKIGTQTIRSKSGFSGKPQDTVQFDREFQEQAVLISHSLHEKDKKRLINDNISLRTHFETYELVEDD